MFKRLPCQELPRIEKHLNLLNSSPSRDKKLSVVHNSRSFLLLATRYTAYNAENQLKILSARGLGLRV